MEKTLRLTPCCLKPSAIPREKDATWVPCYSVKCVGVGVGEVGGGGGVSGKIVAQSYKVFCATHHKRLTSVNLC